MLITVTSLFAVVFYVVWHNSRRSYFRGRSYQEWARRAQAGDPTAIEALKAAGSRAVPKLSEVLLAHDTAFRKKVWFWQTQLPPREREIAWRKIGYPDAVTRRESAAVALGIIGKEAGAAAPMLVTALSDSEGAVRWNAATAIGRIGGDGEELLERCLQDADVEVRHAAAYALGQIGAKAEPAIPFLIRALGDANEQVRNSASEALSRIGPPALPALEAAAEAGDRGNQEAALRALEKLRFSLRAQVGDLVRETKGPDPRKRILAIGCLETIKPSPRIVLQAFSESLNDSVSEVKLAAINALAHSGKKATNALPVLVRLAETGPAEIRDAARSAIDTIGPNSNLDLKPDH